MILRDVEILSVQEAEINQFDLGGGWSYLASWRDNHRSHEIGQQPKQRTIIRETPQHYHTLYIFCIKFDPPKMGPI